MIEANRSFPGRYMPIPERVVARIRSYIAPAALLVPRCRKPCDLWVGPLNGAGYPMVYWRDADGLRRDMTAGMAIYTLDRGHGDVPGTPIPESMYACHTCDAKTCVTLDHLFEGTAHMNAKDTWRRGSSRDQGVLYREVRAQIELRCDPDALRTLPVWLTRQAALLHIDIPTVQSMANTFRDTYRAVNKALITGRYA